MAFFVILTIYKNTFKVNRKKPENSSLLRQENIKEIMINHKGTMMTTEYKLSTWNNISAKLLKIQNHD